MRITLLRGRAGDGEECPGNVRIIGEQGEPHAPTSHGMSHVPPDLQCVAAFVWG